MKLLKIFRFEFGYQFRRLSTWLFFAVLATASFFFVRGTFLAEAQYADFFLNSPYVIGVTTVFMCMLWVLLAGAVSGEIAARDMETGMHPLTFTAPVNKASYLGGRFLAAFTLNLVIQLAVPFGITLSVLLPGTESGAIGPFRADAYAMAFLCLTVPNTFLATMVQFAWSTLSRKAIAAYLGSLSLFFVAYGGIFAVFYFIEREDIAILFDAFGQITVLEHTLSWSPYEKSTRLILLEGRLLHSRLIWFGVALLTLAITYSRFRFRHFVSRSWWHFFSRRNISVQPTAHSEPDRSSISIPVSPRKFGISTRLHQLSLITRTSFLSLAKSKGGVLLMIFVAALVVLILPEHLNNVGTPIMPRTDYLLTFLTTPLNTPFTPWVIIPLLIVYYAGELVWREREAGLAEITDAAPVPEWIMLLGKYLGIVFMMLVWSALLTLAGVMIQLRLGFTQIEPGLYLKVLFGLQLAEYLLLAILALIIQGVTSQKYVGQFITLIVYVLIIFSTFLGLRHNMLIFGSSPAWKYSDMTAFGTTLGPWLWFKLYWTVFALLLATGGTLFWLRGKESLLWVRLRAVSQRFTPMIKKVTVSLTLILVLVAGFIFYNTNVLHEYASEKNMLQRSAEYELRYGRLKNAPQPDVSGFKLNVELYPSKRIAAITGTCQLVNLTGDPIDTIHVAVIRKVENKAITFNRRAKLVVHDDDHGHRTYSLAEPLLPGDSMQMHFEVWYKPTGFTNDGASSFVVRQSTYFRAGTWMPAIGYQRDREILKPTQRREYGLPARPVIATLEDADAASEITGGHQMPSTQRIRFEAVVTTDEGQIAVAPGELYRSWTVATTDGMKRSSFHFKSDQPVGDNISVFSAAYQILEKQWTAPGHHPVLIQIYHHPQHGANIPRMMRSVRASLDYYTRAYGQYPYSYIRLVENTGTGMGAHAEPSMIDFTQGFSLYSASDDSKTVNMPFAVIAHEVAHQWWGVQLKYKSAEGVGLLTESPAWYSAMGAIENTYGRDHLNRLLRFFRQPFPFLPIRQAVPLLRGKDPYAAYRKGPFALHALSEYIGRDKVDLGYKRLTDSVRNGKIAAATSMDLYKQLQEVTPDQFQYLLHDLFAENTIWELETKEPSAVKTNDGWVVTIPVKARKITVDTTGMEHELPMDELIQVGVFAPTEQGQDFGEQLYLEMHRIKTGEQTITVTVPQKPSDAGIDPYHLLVDLERFNNVEKVKIEN